MNETLLESQEGVLYLITLALSDIFMLSSAASQSAHNSPTLQGFLSPLYIQCYFYLHNHTMYHLVWKMQSLLLLIFLKIISGIGKWMVCCPLYACTYLVLTNAILCVWVGNSNCHHIPLRWDGTEGPPFNPPQKLLFPWLYHLWYHVWPGHQWSSFIL